MTFPPPFDYAAMAALKLPKGWDPTHPDGCGGGGRPLVYHQTVWFFDTVEEASGHADSLKYSVTNYDPELGRWRVEEYFAFYG